MRFRFFETKLLEESSLKKDNDTNQQVVTLDQEVKHTINYSILFLIIATTFFIIIYSFVAYSFLETSSMLLIHKHPSTKELSKSITVKHQKERTDIFFSKSNMIINVNKYLEYVVERKSSEMISFRKGFFNSIQEKNGIHENG